MRARLTLLAALLLVPMTSAPAGAAPDPRWARDGNPIAEAPGTQDSPSALTDGGNGMIVVYRDERTPGSRLLYAQRVLGAGDLATGWPADGVPLSSGGQLGAYWPLPDGAGGALVVFLEGGSLRTQHVLGTGLLAPGTTPAGNVLWPATGGPSGQRVRVTSDGLGGAYVLFSEFDNFTAENIRLTRLGPDGAPRPGWATPVLIGGQVAGFGFLGDVSLVSTATGGCSVAWTILHEFGIGFDWAAFLRRFDAAGFDQAFTDLEAALARDQVTSVEHVSDGGEGCILRVEGGATYRLDELGVPTWPTGTPIVTSGRMLPDGGGGLYLVEPGATSTAVRRLDGSGAPSSGWTAAGVTIPSPFDNNSSYDAKVHAGGLMLAWSEVTRSDVLATYFGADGAFGSGWRPEGNVVSDAHGSQVQPTILPFSTTAALVAWADDRRNGQFDIWANVVRGGPRRHGPPPPEVFGGGALAGGSLALRRVQGSRGGLLRFQGMLGDESPASVELLDVSGRRLRRESLAPAAGGFERAWPLAGLARGVYWVRLAQGPRQAILRVFITD
jgi:hypothetical protein